MTMSTIFAGDLHAGLSGIELDGDYFELGNGITLRKTYAHLMAHFVMAFKPAPLHSFHPGPWKPASGGFTFDVSAELMIPTDHEQRFGSKISVARTIVFLLRLWVNPAATLPVFSNHPFELLRDTPDSEARLLPFEVQDRHFPLGVVGGRASADALEWVKDHWVVTHQLLRSNSEFALAVDAIDSGQFVKSTALS